MSSIAFVEPHFREAIREMAAGPDLPDHEGLRIAVMVFDALYELSECLKDEDLPRQNPPKLPQSQPVLFELWREATEFRQRSFDVFSSCREWSELLAKTLDSDGLIGPTDAQECRRRFELLLAKPFPRFALISRMYNEPSEQEKQEAWRRLQHRFPSIRRLQVTLNLLNKKQESGQRGQEAELSNPAEAILQLGRLKEILDCSLPTAQSTSDVNQDKDGTTLEQKPYGVLIGSLLLRAFAGILERLLELFDTSTYTRIADRVEELFAPGVQPQLPALPAPFPFKPAWNEGEQAVSPIVGMTQVASPGSIGAGLVAGNEKFLVTPSRPARGGRRRKLTPAGKRLYLAILSSYDRGLTDHYELASQHKTDRATVR